MAEIKLNVDLNNGEKLSLGKKELLSLESLLQSTAQPKEIYYGVLPSSGSAEINDIFGNIAKSITNGKIPNSNMPIQITANGKQVTKQITDDSDYDNTNQTFSIQFTDKLSQWDNLQYGGLALDTIANGTPDESNAYAMLSSVLMSMGYTEQTEQIDPMLDTQIVYGANNVVGTVKQYLQSITIPAPYLESGSLREVVERFCLLAQLNVLQRDNGDIKFVQARPIRAGNEPIIVIPPRNQFSAIKKDVIIRNKYDGVELSAKEVKNELYFNELLKTATIQINKNTQFATDSDVSEDHDKNYISPVTFYRVVYCSLECKYIDVTITIPLKSNHNLETITKLYLGKDVNGEPLIKHSISYTKRYGNITANVVKGKLDETSIKEVTETTKTGNGNYANDKLDVSRSIGKLTEKIKAEVSLTNQTTLGSEDFTIDKNNNVIMVRRILVGKKTICLFETSEKDTFEKTWEYKESDGDNWVGYEEYIPKELELSIYGDKRVISFEDLQQSYGNGQNVVSLQGSTLTQSYRGQKTYSQIQSNILSDYANGIETASATVSCGDYYDTNGIKRKTWSQGDILQVGDIVRLDKDNKGTSAFKYANGTPKLWKVTGRKFRHGGCPYVDLELQENKLLN